MLFRLACPAPLFTMKTYAILLDAGFLKKQLRNAVKKKNKDASRSPALANADDIARFVEGLKVRIAEEMRDFGAMTLYRVFYYDAKPYGDKLPFPLSGAPAPAERARRDIIQTNLDVIKNLKDRPFFAVRLGDTEFRGWKVKRKIFDNAKKSGAASVEITSKSLSPDIRQKGVDARLGLDIATLSLKQFVDIIVLVTGDADFASPMAFARKEGRQVLLATLGQSVQDKLRNSADVCIDDNAATIISKAKQ